MKTLALLVVLFVAVPLFTTASALTWEFGGGTGFESRGGELWDPNEEGREFFQYDFRPYLSVFVTHQLTVGAHFQLNIEDRGPTTLTEIEVGPRIGYYLEQVGPGYPFLTTRLSYGFLFYDRTAPAEDVTRGHVVSELGAGYMILLNPYVGVTGGGYYEYHWYQEAVGNWINGNKFGATVGLRIFIY